jgi:hypothetical protein
MSDVYWYKWTDAADLDKVAELARSAGLQADRMWSAVRIETEHNRVLFYDDNTVCWFGHAVSSAPDNMVSTILGLLS